MPSHPNDGLGATPKNRRLPLLHRLVLIAITVVTAWVAASIAPRGGVAAPEHLAALGHLVAVPAVRPVLPFFAESWVTPRGHMPSAHSSTICILPSGGLFAAWYGGTREGAADVALFTARLAAGGTEWTSPALAVDRASAQQELDRSIKKVGNAVIFTDQVGGLWMVYVSVSMGGWSGSALNVKMSQDEGRTWSTGHRLTLNPFLNLSSLVRNKPIYASDGRIGLPVYHEMALKFPQMLWLTPGPKGSMPAYRMRNLASETGLIQPTLVPLDHDRMLMVLRDRRSDRQLHTAYSDDNGWTWSDAAPSALPNPDSAIDALRLRDGRILLVYNHAHRRRENLRFAISSDSGRSWRAGPTLEAAADHEYSYPCLAEDRHGRIHLTYTWRRERIKHVGFNVAWLDGKIRSETPAEQ